MSTIQYNKSWLVQLFHSFPHVDLTFKQVNSSFNLSSSGYREVLLFWAAVPVICLLLILIFFLVYFCYRCCQRDVEKKKPIPCLVWTMAVLALVTIGVAGIAIYGNELSSEGETHLSSSAQDIDANFVESSRLAKRLDEIVTVALESQWNIETLKRQYERNSGINNSMKTQLTDKCDKLVQSLTSVKSAGKNINEKLSIPQIRDSTQIIQDMDFYRWLTTLIFLLWIIALCIFLLLAIGLKSKCTLLVFCACGIFTMVLCWLMAGAHTALCLAMSDLCMNPSGHTKSLALELKLMDKEVAVYYTECKPEQTGPFVGSLQTVRDNLHEAEHLLSDLELLGVDARMGESQRRYLTTLKAELEHCGLAYTSLVTFSGCHAVHNEWEEAVEAVCGRALPGLALVLLACLLAGLLFTALVFLASRAWRNLSRSKLYLDGDVDEPLMFPREENGTYYSFSRSGRGPRDFGPPRRPTPPPAYNTYELQGGAPLVHHDDAIVFADHSD